MVCHALVGASSVRFISSNLASLSLKKDVLDSVIFV